MAAWHLLQVWQRSVDYSGVFLRLGCLLRIVRQSKLLVRNDRAVLFSPLFLCGMACCRPHSSPRGHDAAVLYHVSACEPQASSPQKNVREETSFEQLYTSTWCADWSTSRLRVFSFVFCRKVEQKPLYEVKVESNLFAVE